MIFKSNEWKLGTGGIAVPVILDLVSMFATTAAKFLNPFPYFNALGTSSEELTLPASTKLWMKDFAPADSLTHWSFPHWIIVKLQRNSFRWTQFIKCF